MTYRKYIVIVVLSLYPVAYADKLVYSHSSFTNGHSIRAPTNSESQYNNHFEEVPVFPTTKFECDGKQGYFADIEAGCKVFHICGPQNNQYDFFCSPGTLFNQKFAICDWSYNVNCELSTKFFYLNDFIAGNAEYRSEDQSPEGNIDPPTEWLAPPPQSQDETGAIVTESDDVAYLRLHRGGRSSKHLPRFAPVLQDITNNHKEAEIYKDSELAGTDNETNTEISPDISTFSDIVDAYALTVIPPTTEPVSLDTTPAYKTETAEEVVLKPTLSHSFNSNTSTGIPSVKATGYVRQTSEFRPVKPESVKTYKLTPAVLVSSIEDAKDPITGVRYKKWRRAGPGDQRDPGYPLLTMKPQKPRWIRLDNPSKSPNSWRPRTANLLHANDEKEKLPTKYSVINSGPLRFQKRNESWLSTIKYANKNNVSIKRFNLNASGRGDWSLKVDENELDGPSEGADSPIIRLPLQPTVPVPLVTEETEIEYTENLDEPVPSTGPVSVPDSGDITNAKIIQYFSDPELRQVELGHLPLFKPVFKSSSTLGRSSRVYKIKNKGFRPLTITQTLKNGGKKENIIDLIRQELNLTRSPFSLRLIEIDDPYADRWESQKMENAAVIEQEPSLMQAGDVDSNNGLDVLGQASSNAIIVIKFNGSSPNITYSSNHTLLNETDMSFTTTTTVENNRTTTIFSTNATTIPTTEIILTSSETTIPPLTTPVTSNYTTTTTATKATTTTNTTPSTTSKFYSRSIIDSRIKLHRKGTSHQSFII